MYKCIRSVFTSTIISSCYTPSSIPLLLMHVCCMMTVCGPFSAVKCWTVQRHIYLSFSRSFYSGSYALYTALHEYQTLFPIFEETKMKLLTWVRCIDRVQQSILESWPKVNCVTKRGYFCTSKIYIYSANRQTESVNKLKQKLLAARALYQMSSIRLDFI